MIQPAPSPSAGTALFTLDEVSLRIGDRTVLDRITVSIPDHGITVIQGPSGSGKSTLLRLLNRLEVPTSGRILFRGQPLEALDPLDLRRRVGMVFQRPTPFPGTVRDNLLVADPSAGDDRLLAVLEAAGLDPSFLDRPADDLSGGETQRVCLARTLVTRPEVLLMDEPTSSLDVDSAEHLEETARQLADAGRPVLWVTHDLAQADRLADERIVLVEGHVATDDERRHHLAGRAPGTAGGGVAGGGAAEGAGGRADAGGRRGRSAGRSQSLDDRSGPPGPSRAADRLREAGHG